MLASSTKMLKLLLGSPETDVFAEDSSGDTVFLYVIRRKSLPSLKLLCECEQMQTSDKNKIVKLVFNSHEKDIKDEDEGPIQIALLRRHTKIVEYLLRAHPNPRQWMGDEALMSLIYSKTPTAIAWKMNQSLTYVSCGRHDDPHADFRIITGEKDPIKEKVQETKYLYMITKASKEDQKLTLLHPLVQIFLERKWKRIRILAWIYIIIQFSWIVSYTLMMYEMYRPTDDGANQTETTEENRGMEKEGKSLGILQWEGDQKQDCRFNYMANQCIAVVLYLLSAPVLVKESFQILLKSKAYFRDFINYIQLGILVAAWVNSAPAWQHSSASDVATWQTNLAAIGICGAWVMLLSELDNFPKCAVYSAILKRVLWNCLKTMFFYCPLLLGFAMCFRLLIPGKGQHKYLFFSLIKVVVMMTGELDFEDAFYGDDDTTSGPSTSFSAILGQIMFLLLVIVTTIAVLNLLTGLAVADVRKLLDDAEVDRLSVQLERMYMFDSFILLAREKLPWKNSWNNMLYRWNATAFRGSKTTYYSTGTDIVMKDFPKTLRASIEKAMFEEDEE